MVCINVTKSTQIVVKGIKKKKTQEKQSTSNHMCMQQKRKSKESP